MQQVTILEDRSEERRPWKRWSKFERDVSQGMTERGL